MPDVQAIHPKLCKFRPEDMANIEAIKEMHGFHEDMTAIRYALHLASISPGIAEIAPRIISKKSKRKS